MKSTKYSTYMLLDTSLMGNIKNPPWLKDRRCRGWMERIYDQRAAIVSPVLLDIDVAYQTGRIAEMMEYSATCNPKFHVSFIDTQLSLVELTTHLRQLVYFIDKRNQEFTLRFADGAVLCALEKVLTPAQWKSIYMPIIRWRVHDREDRLITLPLPLSEGLASFPLSLDDYQISQLKEEMAVYQILANLKKIPNKIEVSFSRKYELVSSARKICQASGQSDNETLWKFLSSIFHAEGEKL